MRRSSRTFKVLVMGIYYGLNGGLGRLDVYANKT
jgi:hypothetical protein